MNAEFLKSIKTEFPADFLTDQPTDLAEYGRDWTKVYPPKPSAVVFPRSTAEVVKFLKLCNRHDVAVVPSGGRTGLSGGAVAAKGEVVLSLSRMNHMGEVDPLSQTVRVQAGAVTEAVHEHCKPHGLTWPVDFASKGSSQVGGNISTNAGGVKVIHYGNTRNWVLGLQVVTMQGEILELNGALEKNNTGLDLRQLFISTEGTLGVVTEAVLKLVRLPSEASVFFFAVKDIPSVFRLFQECRRAPFTLMAFETLTDNCLESVVQHLKVRHPFPENANSHAYVLVEVEKPQTDAAQEVLDQWLSSLFEKDLVADGTLAQSPAEARELWQLREGVSESLMSRAFVHKNDISLPIYELENFLGQMTAMFAKSYPDFGVYIFGHIGDGNLHVNIMKPDALDKAVFQAQCKQADKILFELVCKFKGSISAEHGVGLLKKEALLYSRPPEEVAYLRAIKKIFDPKGLLNPGKILD